MDLYHKPLDKDPYFDKTNRYGKKLRVLFASKSFIENNSLNSCNGVEEKVINKDIVSKLPMFLNDRDYEIITRKYFAKQTLKEIGRAMSLTEARICQLRKKILNDIRQQI